MWVGGPVDHAAGAVGVVDIVGWPVDDAVGDVGVVNVVGGWVAGC